MDGHRQLEAWLRTNNTTQRDLCRAMGLSTSMVSHILNVRQRPNAFVVEWCRVNCGIEPQSWLLPLELERIEAGLSKSGLRSG